MSTQKSRISDEEINELISKLQSLLPESRRRNLSRASSASKLLKETCSNIKSLHREVDDLSGRLSHLTSTLGPDSPLRLRSLGASSGPELSFSAVAGVKKGHRSQQSD